MTSTRSPIVLTTNTGKVMDKWEAISVGKVMPCKKIRIGRSRVWIQVPATIYLAKFVWSVLVISSCHWICHLFDWELFRQELSVCCNCFPNSKLFVKSARQNCPCTKTQQGSNFSCSCSKLLKESCLLDELPQLQRTIVPKTNLTVTRATTTEEATTCWAQL